MDHRPKIQGIKNALESFRGRFISSLEVVLFFLLAIFLGKFLVLVLELVNTASRIQEFGLTGVEGV
jgi:hypothetical protein